MNISRGISRFALAVLATLTIACTDADGAGDGGTVDLPPVVRRVADAARAPTTDRIEVWVCRIPVDTVDPVYGGRPLRLPITPADIVDRTEGRLGEYFDTLSHGAYEVVLTAGGTVAIDATQTSADCADLALDRSTPEADAVLVVADAEHAATAAGGWGRTGTWPACEPDCSARSTRRAMYVGASDFHPDWGPVPAMDLLQHEIGHLLGLPHSGDVADGESGHTSALDVMSNSAAPRDVDPSRLDGPGTLAINRLALGWLPVDGVVTVGTGGQQTVELGPSSSLTGARMLVLPLDEHRAISVELITADGYDAHLPGDGIAIHLIDDTAGTGIARRQQTLGSTPPHADLLADGESLTVEGWEITVVDLAERDGTTIAEVAVTGLDR